MSQLTTQGKVEAYQLGATHMISEYHNDTVDLEKAIDKGLELMFLNGTNNFLYIGGGRDGECWSTFVTNTNSEDRHGDWVEWDRRQG